jgi:hypothetical protein
LLFDMFPERSISNPRWTERRPPVRICGWLGFILLQLEAWSHNIYFELPNAGSITSWFSVKCCSGSRHSGSETASK